MSHSPRPLPPAARHMALMISMTAILALVLQFQVSHALLAPASVGATLWRMAGYFTILTNVWVAVVMLGAAGRYPPGARSMAALTLAIVMVGIVYHLILARLWAPKGLAWWADQGLHTVVPVLTLLWWLAFAGKSVGRRDLPFLMIWPAAYSVYALIRGAVTGFWPYPFLDAGTLGWPMVTINIAALVAAFAGLGLCLIALARRLVR